MSTRIGLISDVHADTAPLRQALAIFERERVTQILCPGDVVGYGEEPEACVNLLQGCGAQVVRGNHERWFLERGEGSAALRQWLEGLPTSLEMVIEGVRLYMVHASPPDSDMDGIKLLDERGEVLPSALWQWQQRLRGFGYELLLVGHTHQLFAEQLGEVMLINPGSSAFNHSCAVLHLPERRIDWYAVGGEISRVWNWGMLVPRAGPA